MQKNMLGVIKNGCNDTQIGNFANKGEDISPHPGPTEWVMDLPPLETRIPAQISS